MPQISVRVFERQPLRVHGVCGWSTASRRLGSHAEQYLPLRYTEFSVGTVAEINWE